MRLTIPLSTNQRGALDALMTRKRQLDEKLAAYVGVLVDGQNIAAASFVGLAAGGLVIEVPDPVPPVPPAPVAPVVELGDEEGG